MTLTFWQKRKIANYVVLIDAGEITISDVEETLRPFVQEILDTRTV